MPVESFKQFLHLRQQKNQQVHQNIERLWSVGRKAESEQQLLDALHPWGDTPNLRFYNFLPTMLSLCSILILCIGLLLHPIIHWIWSGLLTAFGLFLSYLCYENKTPLQEVIQFLEQRMISLRYQLDFQKLPPILLLNASPHSFLNQLKQLFPLFEQGNISNDISLFASTLWRNSSKQHYIIVFQYHFVNEQFAVEHEKARQVLKKEHQDLWGAFIFDMPALGIAVSNQGSDFKAPYSESWHSTDILTNQRLRIYGLSQHELARVVQPHLTLKLNDFFEHFDGDFIYHHKASVACYLGKQNLFQVNQPQRSITDISTLRGHLRTLNMPIYQKFNQQMLRIISS